MSMDVLSSLLLLFEIVGVNAASGIYYDKHQVYIISDNSPFLYQYDMNTKKVNKIVLESSFNIEVVEKKNKLDLEALCIIDDQLVMLGSGSTAKREYAYTYNRKTGEVKRQSLTRLYKMLRRLSDLDMEDFNIEAVSHSRGTWYFLNRGNGVMNKNMVFSFKGNENLESIPEEVEIHSFDLPDLQGTAAGFSDACIIDDKLFYVATAEDIASTYRDGEVKGSYMGYIDLTKWTLGPVQQIAKDKKIEGLTLFKKSDMKWSFMVCEDPDDSSMAASKIFAFDFELK